MNQCDYFHIVRKMIPIGGNFEETEMRRDSRSQVQTRTNQLWKVQTRKSENPYWQRS